MFGLIYSRRGAQGLYPPNGLWRRRRGYDFPSTRLPFWQRLPGCWHSLAGVYSSWQHFSYHRNIPACGNILVMIVTSQSSVGPSPITNGWMPTGLGRLTWAGSLGSLSSSLYGTERSRADPCRLARHINRQLLIITMHEYRSVAV